MNFLQIVAKVLQSSERSVRMIAFTGLFAALLSGCDSKVSGPKPGLQADCIGVVRAALEKVDHSPSPEQQAFVIITALDALGTNPAARCERDLLLELMELQAMADSTDKLIRTCERLLALDDVLSPDQNARVKLDLAEAYFKLGIPKSFDLAKDVFLQWDSMNVRSSKMFRVTSLLVQTYDLTNELEEGGILLQGAVDKARKQGDPLWTGELLDRLADLYVRQGKAVEAIDLQREGLVLLDRLRYGGVPHDTLIHRMDLAVPSGEKEGAQDDRSIIMQDSTPRLLTIRDQLLLRHRLRYHMGEAYRILGMSDSARTAFQEALTIAMGSLGGEVEAPFVELGELMLADGTLEGAISNGAQGLSHARQAGDPQAVRKASTLLYKAYKQQGDVRNALAMHELAQAYGDSLGGRSFAMGLQKKQVLYEVRDDSLRMANALGREQLERVNAQLEASSNRTVAIAIGGIGLLLLAGAGVWFTTDRKRRRERFDRESAQLETQALRSQMNPHFIFNALNSINAYVQQNDQDSASSYLTKFARVMRAVLENSRHGEVTLSEDLDALRGYMELERMRMQHKFTFSIEVAPEVDPDEVLVPPLVVQPFVENAIWHGMARKEGNGHITLKVDRRGEQLVWTIEDDGVGRSAGKVDVGLPAGEEDALKKTSLGTAITRARLDLVQKQHGGKAGFRYIDLLQGTRVEVDLPLMLA